MNNPYKLMLNIDINSVVTPFLNSVVEKQNPSQEDLYPFVDQYAHTDITDILFDVFCQYSAVDSQIWSTYADKCTQKEENGVAVDYTKEFGALYKLNRTHGLEPYGIWIQRTRALGMRPWVSVRMNDCHCPDEEACFLRSDFFYEAREKGWMIGDRYGYYRYCFDYGVPAVREKMLGYIRELLERYDVDGIELDFQREILCFDYQNNPDCHQIMTAFMGEAKGIVNEAEAKYGHKIALGTRVSRDIEQSKRFGFDVVTWAKEGLVDLVVPTPRWATNDDDMPIDAWKDTLPDTVAVQAGLEVLVNRQTFDAAISAQVARSLSAKYLSEGSDGIYLFNHFIGHGNSRTQDEQFREIFVTCGSLDKALQSPSRYVVQWQDTVPAGFTPYKPLPLTLSASGETKTLPINLGILPSSCTCTMTLGIQGGDDIAVTVNGEPVVMVDAGVAGEKDFCVPGTKLVQCSLAKAENARFTVQMRSTGGQDTVVTYAEIFVEPKER